MPDPQRKNNLTKKVALSAIFLASALALSGCDEAPQNLAPYSDFVSAVDQGKVSVAELHGQNLTYMTKDGQTLNTFVPENENVAQVVRGKDVSLSVGPRPTPGFAAQLLMSLLPMFLFLGFFIFIMRRMGGGGGVTKFGQSKAKLLNEVQGRVTFADVAGIDDAKEELQEIVDFLKDPQKFSRLGAKIPKGALMVGPPGTGKTLTARAVAGEAGVPFYSTSGSEFVEMFVGVGASRVRDMFEQAKKNAPCIIFIDEIDAIGRARGNGPGSNDEREQTLNQLLVEMDGFEGNEGIIVIAATNRKDVLDPALTRPGRFDRQVTIGLPDVTGREKILKVHASKVPCGPDVDLKVIARGTPGFAGADLANLVNEAALMAGRKGRKFVTLPDFEEAKDKILMGPERKSLIMSPEERRLTAYHEAGHAVLGVLMPGCDPVHKATIMPRGGALGMVVSLPEGDRVSMSRQKMMSDLVMTAGGRAAEEIIFGDERVTSGASGDIDQMTRLSTAMVKEWGMSAKVGMMRLSPSQRDNPYAQSTLSEKTREQADAEVRALTQHGHETAVKVLTENRDKLDLLAEALLKYETLTGDEVRALVREGKQPEREEEPAELDVHAVPQVKRPTATKAPKPRGPNDQAPS